MSAKKLIASVILSAATGSVFSAEVTEGVWPASTLTKSRAEVIAELEAAKADGSYAVMHQEYEGQYARSVTRYAGVSESEKPALADNAEDRAQIN